MPVIKLIKEIVPEEALVAVSMGSDSIGAYEFLSSRRKAIPIHFNHCLRPQNYEAEDKFRNTYPYGYVGRADSSTNLITENDFRQARIEFYKEAASHFNIRHVVTAHHIQDWIEGYLLNCLRGQPDRNPLPLRSEWNECIIVHPFLLTSKLSLIQYLERNNKINLVVNDETNDVIKGSRRNWIRNVMLPAMKEQEISLVKFAKRSIEKENHMIKRIKIMSLYNWA